MHAVGRPYGRIDYWYTWKCLCLSVRSKRVKMQTGVVKNIRDQRKNEFKLEKGIDGIRAPIQCKKDKGS